jgi:hypothetical protein
MILGEREQFLKRRRIFRLKFYGAAGLTALIFILLFALITQSSYFQIQEINITGIEDFKKQAVLSYLIFKKQNLPILKYLGYGNILLWNDGEIKFETSQIEGVQIEVDLTTRKVNIEVKEKQRFLIWCRERQACFWLGPDGTILEEAPRGDGQLVDVINGSSDMITQIGAKILDDKKFINLIKILTLLKGARFLDRIIYVNSKGELLADLSLGPTIFFNLAFDPGFSEPVLNKLRLRSDFKNLQYLDFRIENKAYYK